MKKTTKQLFASILLVAMLFSLAACGRSGQSSQSGAAKPSQSGKVETPAFTYVSSFREIKNDKNEALGVIGFTDKGFYTTTSDVVGRREPEEGETEEWEGQFDIREEGLAFVGFDGTITKLDGYVPFKVEEIEGHDVGSELFKLASDAEGNLAAIYHSWDSWNDVPEGVTEEGPSYWDNYHYDETWYLRTMDPSGREQSFAQIDTGDSGWFWVNSLTYADGKLLVLTADGLLILDPDGSKSAGIKVDGYPNALFRLRDGSVCLQYSDNVNYENHIAVLDTAKGRVSKTWDCPSNAYNLMSGGGDYDLYYQSGVNVYGWKLEEDKGEKLFDWLNADVLEGNISGWTVLDDGSVFAVTNNWDSKWENVTTEFVTLEKKPYDSVPHKEELTLACQWADSALQNAVIRFNRTSNVRIRVIDYSQYNNEDDWNAGLTKLTTEIMSGQMPDILSLSGLPYQQLAAKGLLEDLYPYIDADKEFSRDDFLPNVLQALECGGKLCSTVTTFNLVTLAGAASVVGDEPGWSFDELQAALAKMPEGCSVLDEFTTSGDILRDVVTIDADYYIDWNTGKVNFDSKEFIDTLEFSRLFPNAFDSMNYNWEEYESAEQRIREGKQLLNRMYLSSFDDITMNEMLFGGDMTYIGFPTASGVGSYLNVDSGYGISSSCADKQAAWSFLRGFMTEKGMDDGYYWGFPANRKLLEKELQEAMTVEYEKDAKGNYLLDEKGEMIPVSRGGVWNEATQDVTEFYSVTQAQADKIMELINGTTKLYSQNSAVLKIIYEQTDAFFSGQKSAEEVAKLVQGKLSIYVNEQR